MIIYASCNVEFNEMTNTIYSPVQDWKQSSLDIIKEIAFPSADRINAKILELHPTLEAKYKLDTSESAQTASITPKLKIKIFDLQSTDKKSEICLNLQAPMQINSFSDILAGMSLTIKNPYINSHLVGDSTANNTNILSQLGFNQHQYGKTAFTKDSRGLQLRPEYKVCNYCVIDPGYINADIAMRILLFKRYIQDLRSGVGLAFRYKAAALFLGVAERGDLIVNLTKEYKRFQHDIYYHKGDHIHNKEEVAIFHTCIITTSILFKYMVLGIGVPLYHREHAGMNFWKGAKLQCKFKMYQFIITITLHNKVFEFAIKYTLPVLPAYTVKKFKEVCLNINDEVRTAAALY